MIRLRSETPIQASLGSLRVTEAQPERLALK